MSKDYYKTLGVDKKANKDEIKKAFYKLAHQHHPDKNKGDDKKFKEVNEAYQTLSDDKKRAQYDQFGSAGAQGGGGGFNYDGGQQGGFGGFDFSGFGGGSGGGFEFDMGDIFDMFGGGGRSGKSPKQSRGQDLQVLIEVSISESYLGVNKKINYTRHAKCDTCKGSRCKPGSSLKDCKTCSGKGVVNKTQKTIFGNFAQQAVCDDCEGYGKIPELKCVDCKGEGLRSKKEEVTVPIPEGVENGQQLLMRGYGEGSAGGTDGDLHIVVQIAKKKHLSKKARELLEQLQREGY